METVISIVRDLSESANEADRKDIILALRDLAHSIESPDDTMGRILFIVSLISNHRSSKSGIGLQPYYSKS